MSSAEATVDDTVAITTTVLTALAVGQLVWLVVLVYFAISLLS